MISEKSLAGHAWSRNQALRRVLWVIRERNPRLLWLGRASTYLGDQLHEIALVWIAWEMTRSSTLTGLAALAMRAPLSTFTWLAGVYADRLPRQATIVATNGASAGLAFAIVLIFAADALSYPVLLLMAFALGMCRSLEAPALNAHVPSLVPPEAITQINAVADNTKRVARLSASLLVAAMKQLVAVAGLYAVAGIAYLAMSICAAMFHSRPISRPLKRERFVAELMDGWRALTGNRGLRLTVAGFAIYSPAYSAAYWIGLPRLCGDTLAGGIGGYSVAVGASAAGGLVGNACVTIANPRRHAVAAMSGICVLGTGFAFMAAASGIPMVGLLAFFAAFGLPLMDICVPSLIHESVPALHVGRVYSLWRQFAETGMGIGLLLGGPLVDALGARIALVVFGGYAAVVAVLFMILVGRSEYRATRASADRLPGGKR
jgi:MFS transporter, DHA3 family, macrolide efflux protein